MSNENIKRDNSTTRRFLDESGISNGMRVLEIGCGPGEVTEILTELVGSSGQVVAIDNNEQYLRAARDRLQGLSAERVHYELADVNDEPLELSGIETESFDALVGRRVLMYLNNPSDTLRNLCAYLKRGAKVVFEEVDLTMVPGRLTPMNAHDKTAEYFQRMLAAEGADSAMGFRLPTTYVDAGIAFDRIRAEAVIEGQGSQYTYAQLLSHVQDRLEAGSIATKSEIKSLQQELEAESQDATRVYVSGMSFCAFGCKP
tara:strand:+ start:672197 stop:672970 length:774 start_codon:yes stop_codon:yes gene_type:complete